MPKHKKCFTLESYHHGSGEVYRFACSDEYGARTIQTSYSSSVIQPPKGMNLGIVASNLDNIATLLIEKINNNDASGFKKLLSRDFIFPGGEISKSSWQSGSQEHKWGEDKFYTCSVQPVVEVIHFLNYKQKIFETMKASLNINSFFEIYNTTLNKSLSKLQSYKAVRNNQEDYTGSSLGHSKQEKLAAANLLQRFYLGEVDTTTFYSRKNLDSRKAMKQGRLGDIYRELESVLPKL